MMFALLLAATTAAAPPAVPAPGAAAGPDTRFGVIATTQGREADDAPAFIRHYDRLRASYGGPIGIRLFSSGKPPLPGDGSLPGSLLTWAAARHPDEPITVSHKTRDDARVKKLVAWVEKHRLRASVIFFHEVQDNWGRSHDKRAEPAAYRATYRAYRAIIDAGGARDRVTLEKNLTWYWQRYEVPRGRGAGWREFVERDDPADVLSWDTYVFPGMPTAQGRYAEPAEFLRYARDAWTDYRLPWGLGEIGTKVQDGSPGAEKKWDPSGAKFAAWVRSITEAARRPATIGPDFAALPPARFVKWWGGPDSRDRDQSLEQSPAAVATYRRLVGARPL